MSDGAVEMVLDIRDDKVIQKFRHAMDYVAYDPQNAHDVGMQLVDFALELDPKLARKLNTAVSMNQSLKIGVAEKRIEVVLNSQRERKKVSNKQLARELVTIMANVML